MPFRLKLGILLLIIVLPMLVSQLIYRRAITSLHDALYSSIVVLNTIHATEEFHAALHSVLNVTRNSVAEPNNRVVPDDWNKLRESTAKTLDALRDSLQQISNHGQHANAPEPHPADAIATLFDLLMVELETALSGPASEVPSHMAAAQKLFDEIFQNHIDKLHDGHQQRFDDLKADAHGFERQIDLLFYGQTLFAGVVVLIAVFFSEKILVKGYLRTKDASLSDGLTEARNRRYLATVSDRQVAGMLERNEPFSLALLDIDHFKHVNDTFGHDAGDKVLRIVAEVVRKRLRKSDTFVRYGGEEFLVLLLGAEKEAAIVILEAIRKGIETTPLSLVDGDDPTHITVSAGLASFPEDAVGNFSSMQKLADERLYQAKSSGRNQCVSQDLGNGIVVS
jgi:diguanylate cyclase (GGDEF)-like protein